MLLRVFQANGPASATCDKQLHIVMFPLAAIRNKSICRHGGQLPDPTSQRELPMTRSRTVTLPDQNFNSALAT